MLKWSGYCLGTCTSCKPEKIEKQNPIQRVANFLFICSELLIIAFTKKYNTWKPASRQPGTSTSTSTGEPTLFLTNWLSASTLVVTITHTWFGPIPFVGGLRASYWLWWTSKSHYQTIEVERVVQVQHIDLPNISNCWVYRWTIRITCGFAVIHCWSDCGNNFSHHIITLVLPLSEVRHGRGFWC